MYYINASSKPLAISMAFWKSGSQKKTKKHKTKVRVASNLSTVTVLVDLRTPGITTKEKYRLNYNLAN